MRNRKRKSRRSIYCPIHGVYLDSASQKFPLYADSEGQLRSKGFGKRTAMLLMATYTTIPLVGEWLEAFWCDECQQVVWYHVKKTDTKRYELKVAPEELWMQASGVISPEGNPSVGEFTRRSSRAHGVTKRRDFNFVL